MRKSKQALTPVKHCLATSESSRSHSSLGSSRNHWWEYQRYNGLHKIYVHWWLSCFDRDLPAEVQVPNQTGYFCSLVEGCDEILPVALAGTTVDAASTKSWLRASSAVPKQALQFGLLEPSRLFEVKPWWRGARWCSGNDVQEASSLF